MQHKRPAVNAHIAGLAGRLDTVDAVNDPILELLGFKCLQIMHARWHPYELNIDGPNHIQASLHEVAGGWRDVDANPMTL